MRLLAKSRFVREGETLESGSLSVHVKKMDSCFLSDHVQNVRLDYQKVIRKNIFFRHEKNVLFKL